MAGSTLPGRFRWGPTHYEPGPGTDRSSTPVSGMSSFAHTASAASRSTAALGWDGRHAIDHVAVGRDLHCEAVGVIGSAHGGWRLSDHFGVFADVLAREDA